MECSIYGCPCVVRNTFIEVDWSEEPRVRSTSAPPGMSRDDIKETRPKKKSKKQLQKKKDYQALVEGKALALKEAWTKLGSNYIEKTKIEAKRELESRKMKFRLQLKSNVFVQLVNMMKFKDGEVIIMKHKGLVKESSNNVEVAIHCSDKQLQNLSMRKFVSEGIKLQKISKDSIFLVNDKMDMALFFKYKPRAKIADIKKTVQKFWKFEDVQSIRFTSFLGDEIHGQTLRDAGIGEGDSIIINMND